MSADRAGWWNRPQVIIAAILLTAVPLIWPDIPPLVDLPGHMGRYRVQLDGGETPWLADWYRFEWQLIGNLGVDLLIVPMAKLFGLELGVKLIVVAIPVMTAGGLLWIAREVHGRVPPTAFAALPLIYGFPFHFGFVNFALSMALALLAFAFWLRLARTGRLRLRAFAFVPISILIWTAHAFGWGVLGVLAFCAEAVRLHGQRSGVAQAVLKAALACLPMALPLALMVLWRSGGDVSGQTADWFNWQFKYQWLTMVLRDRWRLFDIVSLAAFLVILLKAARDPDFAFARNLGLAALVLLAIYVLLPRILFGSAYADMRLAPFMIAIAVIAVAPGPALSARGASIAAALAISFFTIRIGANTVSFWLEDRTFDRELKALDHVPVGGRLVSFTGDNCGVSWHKSRLDHLPAFALIRRSAFSNDQWAMAGAQLLTVTYRSGGAFTRDPSQITTARPCGPMMWLSLNQSLKAFPRDGFDYVWLIDPPAYDPANLRGLTPIWRDGKSVLFRVDQR